MTGYPLDRPVWKCLTWTSGPSRPARRGREAPFFHSYSANEGAIRLYRSLGFVARRVMDVTILEAA